MTVQNESTRTVKILEEIYAKYELPCYARGFLKTLRRSGIVSNLCEFKASIYSHYRRTFLKELIRQRASRDLDKNLFESEDQNFDVYYWMYHTDSEGFMIRTFEK